MNLGKSGRIPSSSFVYVVYFLERRILSLLEHCAIWSRRRTGFLSWDANNEKRNTRSAPPDLPFLRGVQREPVLFGFSSQTFAFRQRIDDWEWMIGNGTIQVPFQNKRENGNPSHLSSPDMSKNPVYWTLGNKFLPLTRGKSNRVGSRWRMVGEESKIFWGRRTVLRRLCGISNQNHPQ